MSYANIICSLKTIGIPLRSFTTLPKNLSEQCEVEMNSTLASVLVTNLAKNAFIHNSGNGTIDISLVNGTLRVANSGVAALNQAQVFERFYQGSKREGSTGLGFDLRYEVSDKQHIFLIKFR